MIESVVWNTGAVSWEVSSETAYKQERGSTTGKMCTAGVYCTDTVTRTTTWTGKIGLIYPSDYGYASTNKDCRKNINDKNNWTCKNNNWLHDGTFYWTLSPFALSDESTRVFRSNGSGCVDSQYVDRTDLVRPSIYLRSNVSIISGEGSSSSPYQVSMN